MRHTLNVRRPLASAGIFRFAACVAFISAVGLPQAHAQAQRSDPEAAQQRYQAERAACLNNTSRQDKATCLKEAGAALAEARRDGLTDPGQDAVRNQRQRCEALPAADRRACIARMSGQGTTRGSAAEGGIYRELKTPMPGAPAAPFMPPSAPTAASAASGTQGSGGTPVVPAASAVAR